MLRIVFRSVLVLTLTLLAIIRTSGSRMPESYAKGFSYWFLFSGLLALIFLVYSAVSAVRDARNRRLYIRDAMLAVVWVVFWLLSLGR